MIGVLEVDNPGVDVGTGALARLASLASGLLHKETLIERSSLTVKRNSKLVSLLLGIANECETPAVIEKVIVLYDVWSPLYCLSLVLRRCSKRRTRFCMWSV